MIQSRKNGWFMLIKKQVFALSLQNDKQSKFSPSTLQINQTQCPNPCESLAKTPWEGYYSPLQWSYKSEKVNSRRLGRDLKNGSKDFSETLHVVRYSKNRNRHRAGLSKKILDHPKSPKMCYFRGFFGLFSKNRIEILLKLRQNQD